MGVSTNGVFHYTSTIKNLISILSNGFYPSYCKEIMIYGKKRYDYAVPMVSFCDIPLSEINDHIAKYGSFAIGLSREWAKENMLNPVIYIEKNSSLGKGLNSTLDYIFKDWHERLDDSEFDRFYELAYKGSLNVIYSSKNYEGRLVREGKDKNYIFYNEREWRYIPQIEYKDITTYKDIFWEDEFEELAKIFNTKPHFSDYGIEFKAKDIKYIILPDDSNVNDFFDKLEKMNHLFDNADDYKLILTRILTLKQIQEDF